MGFLCVNNQNLSFSKIHKKSHNQVVYHDNNLVLGSFLNTTQSPFFSLNYVKISVHITKYFEFYK